ncbi:Uncharacterized protein dnm_012030 [Desulfonema magnum]|uniref:Uncharacterized protein n=1 Tax=Desulfonema magnum TaxID=45655 RepID=A0A975GLV4_9BACT|nr:Uncharacterized protein dnm_012030 [Desulfonema magnum]
MMRKIRLYSTKNLSFALRMVFFLKSVLQKMNFLINGHELPVTTNDESFTVFPNT